MTSSSSTIYEFRVDGCLPEHCREAFCGMQLEEVPSGLILRGPVIDQSHLLGIVSELRVLGVSLVSMRPSNRPEGPVLRSTSRLPTGTWTRRTPRTPRTRRLLRRPL